MGKISSFRITNLHGYKNYDILFRDNTLILVGENGSGKSTILRIIFYFLSYQWNNLISFQFDELFITIDGQTYSLSHNALSHKFKAFTFIKFFPQQYRREIIQLCENINELNANSRMKRICEMYGVPFHYVIDEIEEKFSDFNNGDFDQLFKSIKDSFKSKIIYLPTYRRIEQDLKIVLKNFFDDRRGAYIKKDDDYENDENNPYFIELVEFGMKDVEKRIDRTLKDIEQFARVELNKLTLIHLRDIVDRGYEKIDMSTLDSIKEDKIQSVLDRIDDEILSKDSKIHLSETIIGLKSSSKHDQHGKIIFHFFAKLLEFQQDLQGKELPISSFCDVCNQYLVDKKLIYDSVNYKFYIKDEFPNKNNKNIELRQLSSGEKQIVSLFSHLFLSNNSEYFVIIDEPELSLSVPWQRNFLMDIINGTLCSGLISATHSPFIYENNLRKYTHSVGEFLEIGE